MHDTLTDIVHFKLQDAVLIAVVIQRLYLNTRDIIRNRRNTTVTFFLGGRHVMVWRGNIGINAPGFTTG